MSKKKKSIQDHFDYILKDFEHDPNPRTVLGDLLKGITSTREYRIDFPPNQITFHPYIVFIIFVYLKRFGFFGKSEKVAWEIPVKFKGTPFILTHRKFGFRIIATSESETITKHGLEAITQIQKAIPFAEQLIEPRIKSTVHSRKIILDNEYRKIEDRYLFFRVKAEEEFNAANKPVKKKKVNRSKKESIFSEFIQGHNESMKRLHIGNYYVTAMLDSYFCLLEHTLVLLLPFIDNKKLNGFDIETFIGFKWKDKYKAIFSLTTDIKALQMLERLDKIKEQLRNPLTHGYFLKNGNSFYVHMEQIGVIPMTLTQQKQQLKYYFGGIAPLTFKDICSCFDDCDKFLYHHKQTKYGMQFIKSGLPIAFDNTSSSMYKSAMTSRKYFDEFIYYMARQHDDAANMDW